MEMPLTRSNLGILGRTQAYPTERGNFDFRPDFDPPPRSMTSRSGICKAHRAGPASPQDSRRAAPQRTTRTRTPRIFLPACPPPTSLVPFRSPRVRSGRDGAPCRQRRGLQRGARRRTHQLPRGFPAARHATADTRTDRRGRRETPRQEALLTTLLLSKKAPHGTRSYITR